jgi:hypothetical protein
LCRLHAGTKLSVDETTIEQELKFSSSLSSEMDILREDQTDDKALLGYAISGGCLRFSVKIVVT